MAQRRLHRVALLAVFEHDTVEVAERRIVQNNIVLLVCFSLFRRSLVASAGLFFVATFFFFTPCDSAELGNDLFHAIETSGPRNIFPMTF